MKKYINIIALIVLFASYIGCSDFLEHDAYGAGSSDNFWKNEADVTEAINAFGNTFAAREGTAGRGIMWFENCSDNLVTGRTNSNADNAKNFKMAAGSGLDVRDTWPRMYQLITMTNNIFRNVPGMDLTESFKNNALGQAHFYRGFAYLWISPYYGDNDVNGGLPIMTENTPVDDLDQPRPKSVLENYDMIIEDMRKAGDLLPLFSALSKSDYGRPHKAAAWAFGARAALYAAQYDSKYYDIVLEFTDKVMKLTGDDKRNLFDDGSSNPFAKLFRKENNFSSEYLFSILGNPTEGPKFHGMSFQNGGFGLYNTWGYFQPTYELYKAFEVGDVRREATILYPGEEITYIGKKIIWAVNPAEISSTSGLTFRKFMSIFEAEDCIGKDVSPNGNNQSNRLGQTLIRYADVLLMRSEALIWKNGEGNAEAKMLLNQIRKRARLPENSTASKAELKNQRRCELAFEFMPSRHLDLVRWGDAAVEYAKPLHGVKTILKKDPQGNNLPVIDKIEVQQIWPSRSFDPKVHHVFPIPLSEVTKSKNLTQNYKY